MNVLSLFDGMSCGQIALNRAGIKIDNYYASEIKEHGIKVTKHNYPNTIHIGDVTKVDFTELPKIDLLIGGSPCQDFSRANKSRLGLRGDKSSLFYYYLKALDVCKPKYFLLENVIMEKSQAAIISNELGVYPIRINSQLVSAQLRDRLYWTNIPGDDIPDMFGRSIAQPKDKKIKLQDVLTSGYTDRVKSTCLLARNMRRTIYSILKRDITFTFDLVFENKKLFEYYKKNKRLNWWQDYEKEYNYKITLNDVRQLNRTESELLQTVPINYTSVVDQYQARNLLGDGWTVDVITHIFKGLK